MRDTLKNYSKSGGKGLLISLAAILLYSLTEFIYFNNQLLLNEYIDTIKTYTIACSIMLYLILVYYFYSHQQNKNYLHFILLSAPHFLLMLIGPLISNNVPRLVDSVYLLCGIMLIYFKFKENSFLYSRKYIFTFFIVFTVFSYPYIYENIWFNYTKSKEDPIALKGNWNFTITDVNGNNFQLTNFKTKTVCVDMWSSACGGCIQSMPDFEKLSLKYKNNSEYKIISLFCPMRKHETYEWFKNYIKEDFNYNIDYYYVSSEEFKKLGIYKFPEFVLLNKKNQIAYRGIISYAKTTYDNIYDMLEKINAHEEL